MKPKVVALMIVDDLGAARLARRVDAGRYAAPRFSLARCATLRYPGGDLVLSFISLNANRAVAMRESLRLPSSPWRCPNGRTACNSVLDRREHSDRRVLEAETRSNGYAEVKAMALRRAKLGDRVKFSERKHPSWASSAAILFM